MMDKYRASSLCHCCQNLKSMEHFNTVRALVCSCCELDWRLKPMNWFTHVYSCIIKDITMKFFENAIGMQGFLKPKMFAN